MESGALVRAQPQERQVSRLDATTPTIPHVSARRKGPASV